VLFEPGCSRTRDSSADARTLRLVHRPELRKKYRREIATELIEAKNPDAKIRRSDFAQAKSERLSRLRHDSPEACALASLAWEEVQDDITTRRQRYLGPLFKNTVSWRHVAQVAGVAVSDFADAIEVLGLRTLSGRLERREARAVLMKLLVRSKSKAESERIRGAIHVFADEPEE
jgi:hypothetical protein